MQCVDSALITRTTPNVRVATAEIVNVAREVTRTYPVDKCDCAHCNNEPYDDNPTRCNAKGGISNPTHPYNIHPELDPYSEWYK